MRMTYIVHIAAGSLALVFGYVALFAPKGAGLHRRSGMAFVGAMLVMCLFGTAIAIGRGVVPAMNVPAGVLTAYLVVTGLTAVRPPAAAGRWLDPALMVVALAVGLSCLLFAAQAIANGGTRNGMPAFPFVMFGIVGVLAGAGDIRMLRSGPAQGSRRLARHLWRMCFALFIAALSFFIGQAKVIPQPIRIMPVLAIPVLVVLASMVYWLWRVRVRGAVRGLLQRSPARYGVKAGTS